MTDYSITELYIFRKDLTKLPDDIDKYTNLEKLSCYNNKLTSLDNLPTTLTELYCWYNKLTSLNNLPSTLEKLYCENNKLTSLDNLPPTLTTLYCHCNNITILDNLPTTLIELHCKYNLFTYNFKPILKNIRNYNASRNNISNNSKSRN